ncbi:hypothetical protein AB0J63_29525 [Streptosporangium canum]|uniref:hypothetical protein n=1 Tax=Streptosporangium canum TaxID=324952 RepID=UPI0034163407
MLGLRYPAPEAAWAAAVRLAGAGPGHDALGLAARETLDHGAQGQVRRVYRRDLGPEAACACAGDLLGPSELDPSLTRVLEVRPAALDGATRREIEERLFERWLAEWRREARLEWTWGTAPRTRPLSQALQQPLSDTAGS